MLPLRIEQLRARGFRNLDDLHLEPDSRFNVIHGDNGAGKTNLLEALYYLSALQSFRAAKSSDLIQLQGQEAMVEARFSVPGPARTATVHLSRTAGRRLRLDGKRPRSTATWHATLQLVLFSPHHLRLASGPAEERRHYLDRILQQMDPSYATALAAYVKAMRSRNRLLREDRPDAKSLAAFEDLMASSGAVVGQTRNQMVDSLGPRAEAAFRNIIGGDLILQVRYQPSVEPTVETLRRTLAANRARDLARGFTTKGPHSDDLTLGLRGRAPARHHASQGQQRAIALALKTAELEVISHRTGRVPALLVDDVSSEFDRTRNRRLFEFLAGFGGQVFLTTTHPEFILLKDHRSDYRVSDGQIEPTRGARA